ncbi:MAG: glutamate carboxypeptidase [Solirubrobacteraceae bacterium]|jgi:glutamate carboxypeptidase|nr:glutamate carboxypeptidase [Solirubrobacteraceae bacterium]
MDPWVADQAAEIARGAERQLEALVGVSSPSGDVRGAEECAAVCAALLPGEAEVERVPCSSPDHARDMIARVRGTGGARILLLGHLDTVVAHDAHQPLRRDGEKLLGSGAVDMKGGDVLALGVLRALAGRPADIAEVALLLVCDEEWRTAPFSHAERFAGWDACLCFEAGERTPDGDDGVVVRRKGAGTLHVTAEGVASHSGSNPDGGRNALLALARVAQEVTARHDPSGRLHLTAVPTVLKSGHAFNVVPAAGELFCDLRADDKSAFEAVLHGLPEQVDGVTLRKQLLRVWPGMDAREPTAPVLGAAADVLGRPVVGRARGGASDASHFAPLIGVTIDGLGPRGGAAHNPGEFVVARTLHERAQVALAVAEAVLQRSGAS